MRLFDAIYNFSFESDENESYFTYSLYSPAIIYRFIMDVSGQIKQLSWLESSKQWNLLWSQPRQQCEVYAYCGAFGTCNEKGLPLRNCLDGFQPKSQANWKLSDYSGGCERKTKLLCEDPTFVNGKQDKFQENSNMKLPEGEQSVTVGSMSGCESTCLNTCSCTAYAYDTDGCKTWSGELLNLQQLGEDDSNGKTIYVRLAASEFSSSSNNKGIIIGAVAGSVGLLLGLVMLAILIWRKRTIKTPKVVEGSLVAFGYRDLLSATKNFSEKLGGRGFGSVFKGTLEDPSELPMLDLNTILVATDNFSIKNKLGQGGFGPVYRGKLRDGKFVAVKRLSSSSGQGLEQFKNVMLISKLQHRNLVRLFGYCIEKEERILIYEFMANKSLDTFLFDPRKKAELNWGRRFNIIQNVARGLLYLHQDSCLRIIHRDLKVNNILLDDKMNPKISDFGLARIFQGTQYLANTHKVVGTIGYMSPEYALGGIFSEKSDVFSFGVLVLEIVNGMKVTSYHYADQHTSLLNHARQLWHESKELTDEALATDRFSPSEVKRCIHVALLCVQDHAENRPTMSVVVSMLSSETELPKPKQPTFTFQNAPNAAESKFNCIWSVSEVTESVLVGR